MRLMCVRIRDNTLIPLHWPPSTAPVGEGQKEGLKLGGVEGRRVERLALRAPLL